MSSRDGDVLPGKYKRASVVTLQLNKEAAGKTTGPNIEALKENMKEGLESINNFLHRAEAPPYLIRQMGDVEANDFLLYVRALLATMSMLEKVLSGPELNQVMADRKRIEEHPFYQSLQQHIALIEKGDRSRSGGDGTADSKEIMRKQAELDAAAAKKKEISSDAGLSGLLKSVKSMTGLGKPKPPKDNPPPVETNASTKPRRGRNGSGDV